MSTPSIDERREVAVGLRGLASIALRGSDDPVGFIEVLDAELFDFGPNLMSDFARRLADLIDPTAHERTVADNLALIDRNRELECELATCKAKLGEVSRIADTLHAEAVGLSELFGDSIVPEVAAQECSFKHWVAEEIREAIR